VGEKKPERRRKKKNVWAGRLGTGLKHHLGAIDHGVKLGARIYSAELGARIYGVELPAKSPPRLRRAQDLGASNDGAELRVQILKSYLQWLICDFFLKKGLKIKNPSKLVSQCLANLLALLANV